MTNDVLAAALAAHAAGLCPIRAADDGTKRPRGAWKQYQNARPSRATIEAWFADGHHGLGLVCGTVSGGLEMVELEGQAVTDGLVDLIDQAMAAAGIGHIWGRVIDGYVEETPSGGYHLLWRTDRPDGNLKLARRPATPAELVDDPDSKVKVLVETRGEGGFTIVAPSNGTTHPSGGAWELLGGGFDTIATITPTERARVLDVLRTFDQIDPPPAAATPPPPAPERAAVNPPAGDRPGDEFNAAHDSAHVLEQAGFVYHHTDTDGAHYTRPGKQPGKGTSAVVWADNGRATLFSTSINAPDEYIGDRNLNAWQLHVALNHHGDHSAAGRAWRDTHPKASSADWLGLNTTSPRPATSPAGSDTPAPAPPPPVDDTPSELDDNFWDARPHLAHIRQAAHSRIVSAEAVLHACLARIAAITPHTTRLPPTIASTCPLSYFAALVGGPSSGKSAADAVAADLLPGPDWLVDHLPLGSGEGLIDSLFEMVDDIAPNGNAIKVKRQTKHNGFVYVDEGQSLTSMGSRSGTTIMQTVRTLWTGGTAGQANASIERRRILPAGTYTFGIVAAFQPALAAGLLDDVAGGTPQRFGWADADDVTLCPPAPAWPGRLPWNAPLKMEYGGDLHLAQPIVDQLVADRYAIVTRKVEVAPLDAHANLYRLKVAGLLAVLDGRSDVTVDDWDLAGIIHTRSCSVRARVVAAVAYEATMLEQSARQRLAGRAAHTEEALEVRARVDCARKVADKVWAAGGLTTTALRRSLTARLRDVLDDGLAHAQAEGWVVEAVEAGQGSAKRLIKPGERRP